MILSRHIRKTVAILANISLLFNSFVPFLLAVQPIYAQDSETIVSNIQYNQSTNKINITVNTTEKIAYQLFYKTTEKIDAIAGNDLNQANFYLGTCSSGVCLPQNISRGILKTESDSGFYSQFFTLENNVLTVVKESESTQLDLTNEENDFLNDSVLGTTTEWTFKNVELNKEYIAPQNNGVKLTFTKLPENSGNIKIQEITLTKEQIKQTGSLSDKAYDITSDMKDGTFAYNLSLPIPESSTGKNVDIKFAEEISQINSAETADNTTETNSTVFATNLDHFTLFIVTYSDSSLTVQKNSYTQGETVYVKGLNFTYIFPLKIVFRDSNGNEITEANCSTETGWSTSCSYKLPDNALVGIWTAELFSNYSKVDSTTFEVLSQNCNYSCPTINFSTSIQIETSHEYYDDCPAGIPNFDGKTCTVFSTVYETKYANSTWLGCPIFDSSYSSTDNSKPCSKSIGRIATSNIDRTYIPATYKTETFNKTVAYEKSATSNNCVKPAISLDIPLWAIDDFNKLNASENYIITTTDGYYLENNTCHQKAKVCTDSKALNYDSNVNINTEVIDNTVCTYTPAGVCPTTCGYSGSNNSIPDGFGSYKICDATAACYVPVCGNGILDPDEQCDVPNDSCTPSYNSSCSYCNNSCNSVVLNNFDNTLPNSSVDLPDLIKGTITINQQISDDQPKSGKLRIWKLINGAPDNSKFFAIGDVNVNNENKIIYTLNTLSNLYGDGSYRAKFTATDEAGNQSVLQKDFIVDNTAPIITVNKFITNNKTPTLTGTINDNNAVVSVKVNNINYTATNNNGTWNVITSALADGTYDVVATATDIAGNPGTDTTTSELTVDSIAPTATHKYYKNNVEVSSLVYVQDLSELTFDSTVTDTFPSSNLKYETFSIFKANLNGTFGWGNTAYCGFRQSKNTYNLSGITDTITGKKLTDCVASLSDGEYYVMHGEYDNAIRQDIPSITQYSDSLGLHFIVDKTAPITTISSPIDSSYFKESIKIIGNTQDLNGVNSVSLSSAPFLNGVCSDNYSPITTITGDSSTSFSWSYDWTPALEGNYCLKAAGTDIAGNAEHSAVIKNIVFDKTIPEVSIFISPTVGDAQNDWYRTKPEISFTHTDINFDKIEYQWDSQTGFWNTYSTIFKPVNEGSHVLYYRAIDKANNISNVGIKNVKWDQTDLELAPQNLSANPNPTSGSTSKIRWEIAKDNIGIDKYEIQWKLNDSNNPLSYSKTVGAGTTEVEIDKLIEGRWTVRVIAFDQSGRSKDNSIDLNVGQNSNPVVLNTTNQIQSNEVFSPEILGASTEVVPTQTSQTSKSESGDILGTTDKDNSDLWKLFYLLLIIPLYIGGRKIFKKR